MPGLEMCMRFVQAQKLQMNLTSRIFCWEVGADPATGDDIQFQLPDFICPECGAKVTPGIIANLFSDAADQDDYNPMYGQKLVCPECETYSLVSSTAHLISSNVYDRFTLLGPRETVIQIRQLIRREKVVIPKVILKLNPDAYFSGLMWFGGWAELERKARTNNWSAPKYLISDLALERIRNFVEQKSSVSTMQRKLEDEFQVELTLDQIRYRIYKITGQRLVPDELKKAFTRNPLFRAVEALLYDDPSLTGVKICRLLLQKGFNCPLRTINKYKKTILHEIYW